MLQRASLLGQLVFHAHRRFGDDDPGEDSLGFELAQPLRQHPIADVGNRAAQLGETHPPVQQQLNHGAGPAALLDEMNPEGREAVLYGNAAALYGLD